MGDKINLLDCATLFVFLSPLIQFLIHGIATRLYKKKSPQMVVIYAIFVGAIMMLVGLGALWINDPTRTRNVYFYSLLYFVLGYFAVAYSYFNLFNISETGRRLKILYELSNSKYLTENKLAQIYGRDDIVQVRLERLCAIGQLEKIGEGYRIKSKTLLYMGHCSNFWHRLLGFNKS